MVLRRITVDNSVRYIPKSGQREENKPIVMKNTRKQNNKISQNNKKFLNNVSASGFKYITK